MPILHAGEINRFDLISSLANKDISLVYRDGTLLKIEALRAIGILKLIGNSVVTVISDQGVYTDISGVFSTGILENFTQSGDTLTYTGFKTETLKLNISLTVIRDSGAAPRDIEAALFINDVEISSAPITMTGEIKNFAFTSIQVYSPSDILKIRIRNNQDTANIVVINYNLVITTI